jgi:hypothetical protein
MGSRAMTARVRAEQKRTERPNRESENTAPTITEAEASSDARKGGPTAV